MSSLTSGGSSGTRRTVPVLSVAVIAIASANVIALMMIIRLVKKSITPAATVAKPILVPVVVAVPISVVIVPVVLKELASSSAVVAVVVVPLSVVVHATAAAASVHLAVLIVLERIPIALLLVLLMVAVVEVRLDLLRPATIHLRLAIVLHLPLAIFPSLQRQLPVHVGLLAIPAAHRRAIAAVGKVLQLLDHVPAAVPVESVECIALELLLLLLRRVRILTTIRLVSGSQRAAVSAIRDGRRHRRR